MVREEWRDTYRDKKIRFLPVHLRISEKERLKNTLCEAVLGKKSLAAEF